MKKSWMVMMVLALVLCPLVLAAESGGAPAMEPSDSGMRAGAVAVSDDKEGSEKFHWANGTITKWDPATKTFVLREEDGQGKKKTTKDVTFSWNEKTTVEGVESRVGEHAKVKYTTRKGSTLAHHVFIGKRAIESHKVEKS